MSRMPNKRRLTSQMSASLDMREDDQQLLLAFLECSECHELANAAVETVCCRVLLCEACLEQRNQQCPKCRNTSSFVPNHLARRMIGTQPWRCSDCGKETSRSERDDHILVCPQRERSCPNAGCSFSGLPEVFLDHLLDVHKEAVLNHAERLFRPDRSVRPDSEDSGESSESDSADSDIENIRYRARHWALRRRQDSTESRRSSAILQLSRVRITDTGKNYCMRRLNGPPCDCCDGRCGPNNGCNCVDCMRLDLVTFNVDTPLTLVNREGAVARISRATNKFYCGRAVMAHDPETDGHCGPNDGHNCHACHVLDQQIRGRYASIAEQWDIEELSSSPPSGIRDISESTPYVSRFDDDNQAGFDSVD